MRDADKKLRVAINAQLLPGGGSGGIETVLMALTALSRLDDGPEEYVFVGHWQEPEWLRPWLGPRAQIVAGPAPVDYKPAGAESLRRALGPLRPTVRRVKQRLSTLTRRGVRVDAPRAANFFERLGCDVIHFPFQQFEPCALPTVFNPHDLQHLHFPEFFREAEFARREATYPAACRAAHTVVVASEFVRRDVVSRYGVAREKVRVIPWSPPPASEPSHVPGDEHLNGLRAKYRLPDAPFALYPAMTWEHKNHVRLLEALALLRDHARLDVPLVCTGRQTDYWPNIERRLIELRLQYSVRFLGVIPYEELCALYRAASFVVIPTLFEAASAPLFEAWQHGVPAACASVTSLPEQAAGAALMFDPLSVGSIAAAVGRMATDAGLREELRRRGARRLRDFNAERTAKAYRAVYRRAAGRALSEEDENLLNSDDARAYEGAAEFQHA